MFFRPTAKRDPTPARPKSTNEASKNSSHGTSGKSPLLSSKCEASRVLSKRRIAEQWKVSRSLSTLVFAGDLCLTVVPIAFIGLSFRALAVDGRPLSPGGQIVIQAAKLGPTVFPIVFAAVVSRLMRCFALWKAERGSELGVLEQLVGSQNLAAAVERAILIRNLSVLCIGIILLWALSPLGGQSSLRVLDVMQWSTFGNQVVYYYSLNDTTQSSFIGASALSATGPMMAAAYQSCLLAPVKVKSSATDLWGNPKLPFLELMPGYDGNSATDKWVEVPDASNVTYSSLTGVVLAGLPPDRSSNFSIQSSYFNLRCSDGAYFGLNYSALPSLTGYYGPFVNWLGPLGVYHNASAGLFSGDGYDWSSFMVDTNWNLKRPPPDSINLIYASQSTLEGPISAYKCAVETSRVEAGITCDQQACRVDRMRRSLIDTRPPRVTPFSVVSSPYMENFLNWFPTATGQIHSAMISPTDLYVSGSDSPYDNLENIKSDFGNVSGKQVSQRLSTLLNTVWQASILGVSVGAQTPINVTAIDVGAVDNPYVLTIADTTLSNPVYVARKVWVGLTATISVILLLCSIAGMMFKYLARAPDILGYVSTMTRQNPYFDDPVGGDAMDGLERARVLKHVQVQIVDGKPWHDRGYVVFRRVSTE